MPHSALTVTQLNIYIKQLMETDDVLSSVCVKGEISNFKHHTSGHMYLTLKDSGGVLKSVMFKSAAYKLKFAPEDGMKIIAYGRISVYEQGGQYQLYIEKMEPDGVGALHVAYEQLKARLEQEGLFDSKYKKSLPPFPSKIAVVTSPTGAAIRDILNVLSRRYPLADVVVCPVLVQGEGASSQIAGAINFINENQLADVIITGRGGGSIEELWAFNEEETARAAFNSKIPIVSAVGHETDFTITDFVADLRAPTPSAAAEIVVPSAIDIKGYVSSAISRMNYAVSKNFEKKGDYLNSLTNRVTIKNIINTYNQKRLSIDYMIKSMERRVHSKLSSSKELFARNAATLHGLSPLAVMSRGYLIAQNKEGKIVKKLSDVQIGENISIQLNDGKIIAEITGKEE